MSEEDILKSASKKSTILSEPEELRLLRPAVLSNTELVSLSARRPLIAIGAIAIDFLAIVLAAVFSEIFHSLAVYLIAVMLIGARQIGIATIIMHDAGVHGSIFKRAKHNQYLCAFWSWLLYVRAIGVTCASFQQTHYSHHQTVNTKEDEDRDVILEIYSMNRVQRVLLLIFLISGGAFIQGAYFQIRYGTSMPRILFGSTVLLLLFFPFADIGPFAYIVKYWIVPLATWGMFINFVRASSEHFPSRAFDAVPNKFRTREIVPSWFDYLFVTTRGINFHFTHHLFPSIPFFRLAMAHKLLVERSSYTDRVTVTRGYHKVFFAMLMMPKIPNESLLE